MLKILVVNDHAVVKPGLMSLLNGKHSLEVIGEAADGKEGIQAAQLLKLDIVLMDLNMPHGMDGLTATTELKRLMPDLAVLVLTMHDDDEYLFRAIHAGASGYIPYGFVRSGFSKGVGLFSMEERAKSIGGEIVIHSELEKGTTITLIVPKK